MNRDLSLSSFVNPDPKELALPHADKLSRTEFHHSPEDEETLAKLEEISDNLGFIGCRYFVEGSRGLVIPEDVVEEQTEYVSLNRLSFEGKFFSFSRVSIGQLVGRRAVSALCLVFNEAIILPEFKNLRDFEESDRPRLLHVPVYAIDEISITN